MSGAQTSTATQRDEAYEWLESSSSPLTLCGGEAVVLGDMSPALSPSRGAPGSTARRSRACRQGEQAAGPAQRSAGSRRSHTRASPGPGPAGSVPHSTSASAGDEGGRGHGGSPWLIRRGRSRWHLPRRRQARPYGEAGVRPGPGRPAALRARDANPPGSRPGCRGGSRAHPLPPPPPPAAAPACAWRGRGSPWPRPHSSCSRRPRSCSTGPAAATAAGSRFLLHSRTPGS